MLDAVTDIRKEIAHRYMVSYSDSARLYLPNLLSQAAISPVQSTSIFFQIPSFHSCISPILHAPLYICDCSWLEHNWALSLGTFRQISTH